MLEVENDHFTQLTPYEAWRQNGINDLQKGLTQLDSS
jgi:hypothetical protein